MVRRVLILTVLLLVGYIGMKVAVGLAAPLLDGREPWERALGPPQEPLDIEGFSHSYTRSYDDLNRKVLYEDQWGEEELGLIRGFVEIPRIEQRYLEPGDSYDLGRVELMALRNKALDVIANRLRAGAPIDGSLRGRFIDLMTEDLYDPWNSHAFTSAVNNVIQSGLADRPGPLRERLMQIQANPDAFGERGAAAAHMVKRKLELRGTFHEPKRD